MDVGALSLGSNINRFLASDSGRPLPRDVKDALLRVGSGDVERVNFVLSEVAFDATLIQGLTELG